MKAFFRFIIAIPVITSLIIAVLFIAMGVYETAHGVIGILKGQVHSEVRPGLKLFEALDIFLIGFLFLIFSIGFAQLFFLKPSKFMDWIDSFTPEWLKVNSFTDLKLILWDTVLTTLVFLCIGDVYTADGHYTWEMLITPIAILLISLSKFLIKRAKKI